MFTQYMTTITCERCGRATTDPDLWDPEADTGRIFCNTCWDHRDDDPEQPTMRPEDVKDGEYVFTTPDGVEHRLTVGKVQT